MKIAYLSSLYARASDTFIRLEVRLLREMGHEVATFSIRRPGTAETTSDDVESEQRGTEYILDAGAAQLAIATVGVVLAQPLTSLDSLALALRTRALGPGGLVRALSYFVDAAYLAGRLRARGLQHLHVHIAENAASVAMLTSKLSGIPFSMTVHGPSEFDRPLDFALAEKVRRSAFVAVISEFTRSQLMRWCDEADWQKIHVIRCGLDTDFLEAAFVSLPHENQLVCVGRLSAAKGQHVLIAALAQLAADGLQFSLDFVGDGELRPSLERAIQQHRLESRVRILGWKDGAGVRKALLDSRLMILSSFAEGLPVVIMEALALGRPVISTYIAGIPELIQSGTNGWLVPAGSVNDLAAALRYALGRTTEELERMGRSGARIVRERHNGAVEMRRLEALILRTAETSAPLSQGMLSEPLGLMRSGS